MGVGLVDAMFVFRVRFSESKNNTICLISTLQLVGNIL